MFYVLYEMNNNWLNKLNFIPKNSNVCQGSEKGIYPRIIRKLFCSTMLWAIYEILNQKKLKNENYIK